jgi:hypothetical protein
MVSLGAREADLSLSLGAGFVCFKYYVKLRNEISEIASRSKIEVRKFNHVVDSRKSG